MQSRRLKKIYCGSFFLDECLCNQVESIFVFVFHVGTGLALRIRGESGLGDIVFPLFSPCILLWSPLSFERTTLPGTMEAES